MKTERVIWAVVILLIIGFGVHREVKNRGKEKGLQSMIEVLNDTVSHHRNQRGEWVAERKSYNLTAAELRKNGQELNIDNAALKKQVGNLNNLVANLKGELLIAGQGTVQLIPGDTIYVGDSTNFYTGHRFDWTNSYLSLDGTLSETFEMNFDYSYNVDFDVTTYWKRPKPFKRKDLIVNMTFADPNAKAVGLNSVIVKPDPPKFFETTWFKVGIGFLGGFFLGTR